MSGPSIAVVAYHLRPGRVAHWLVGGYGVPENYVDALRRAGGRAVLVLPGDPTPPSDLLHGFQGLLLVGGGDVDPARYGAQGHGEIYGVEPDRDALEIDLLREAAERELPTLAVCRGMQVLNVAFGGTLIPHLPEHEGFIEHGIPSGVEGRRHAVKVAAGSLLADATGVEVLTCSSHHHQGVDRVADGLVPTGWSEDGLVEALEAEPGWILGVQWHPEDTAADDPAQQALFDAFVTRARG
ncbi:MAG: gamma-glutamyl-gamma-aminobutyrate hydrolase family protein [Candidatus Velamenicoccus archaeovorus]